MKNKWHESIHKLHWMLRYASVYTIAYIKRRLATKTCFVGITGSAGKTGTKDLVALILSEFGLTQTTRGSFNTPFEIARAAEGICRSDQYFVAELGAFEPGRMARSVGLIKPDIGALTNIGRDHYTAFKSIEAIASEKSMVVTTLPRTGIAVLNIDDPLVRAIGDDCRCRILWIGESEGADIRLINATSRWPESLTMDVSHQDQTYSVDTGLHGKHLAHSVLFALGIALAAGISLEQSIPVLRKAKPSEGRMQIVEGDDGVVFIRDDFKAPYWSLHAPLAFLKEAKAARKIAIIGTISDFSGDKSQKYKSFAREVRASCDLAVFIGPNAHRAVRARIHADDESIQGFRSLREAIGYLDAELGKGDLVLIKGSNRSDHLDRIVLNRQRPIQCWREGCGLCGFCSVCPKVYEPQTGQDTPSALNEPGGRAVLARDIVAPVIVGLGNPGKKYQSTPHNIGYQVLDELCSEFDSPWEAWVEGDVKTIMRSQGQKMTLLKPRANMNLVGPSIKAFLCKASLKPEDCLIVHDDMDLEIGIARLKENGGDGGHNGVRSVIEALGTDRIQRVRVGVRRPGDKASAKKRVLEPYRVQANLDVSMSLREAVLIIHNRAGRVERAEWICVSKP